MNSINKKNILITIAVLMVGLLITGGTYAYLTVAMTVTNGNYATNTHCFNVSYSYSDDGNGPFVPTENHENLIETMSTPGLTVENGVYKFTNTHGGFGETGNFTLNTSTSLVAGHEYSFMFDFGQGTCSNVSFSYDLNTEVTDFGPANPVDATFGENSYSFIPNISTSTIYMNYSIAFSTSCYVTFSNFTLYDNDTGERVRLLLPSSNAHGGISDWVSATADATCGLNGEGTLKMHISSADAALTGTAQAHCENKKTLETQSDYTTQSACTAVAGNKWVTDGTALKYAVFSDNDLYNSGYIKSADVGKDIVVHDNFSVTTTPKKFSVYVWLDGYLSNENYYDLGFNGSVNMVVRQTKSTDTTFTGDTPLLSGYLDQIKYSQMDFFYQRVEYIQSTGTQYIDTGMVAHGVTTDYEIIFSPTILSNYNFIISARYNSSTSRFDIGWGSDQKMYLGYWQSSTNITGLKKDSKYVVKKDGTNYYVNETLVSTVESVLFETPVNLVLFANNNNGTLAHYANAKLYEAKLYTNKNLVRDFIPVYRKSDSKPGLYDAIGGKFYINQATSGNDFTVGPDV